MRTFKIKLNDTITGLANTSWDRDNIVSGRAATEDQLAAASAGSTVTMASWHTLDNLSDAYDMGEEKDIQTYMTNIASGMENTGIWAIAKPKPLEISVSDYSWNLSLTDGREHTEADVKITFPDNSSLVKEAVTFVSDYSVPDRVYAVKLSSDGRGINTYVPSKTSYGFEATGSTQSGLAAVLIGAFTSNTDRTTFRILGGSGKVQGMWPANVEVTTGKYNVDVTQIFSYKIDASGMNVKQAGRGSFSRTFSGTGTTTNPYIYLLDESSAGTYKNGIFREAKIWDGDSILRYYQPANVNGEIVIIEVLSGDILRPNAGTLEEVTG